MQQFKTRMLNQKKKKKDLYNEIDILCLIDLAYCDYNIVILIITSIIIHISPEK